MLVALDSFAAAVFFNRPDLTISALCRVVQLAPTSAEWRWRVNQVLKFNRWQVAVLRVIGWALNSTFNNHCEAARLSDLARAASTIKLLDEAST